MYIGGVYNKLRFGDILKGYPSIIPTIEGPFLDSITDHKIDYDIQNYLVIMDPCCAIERKSLSLTLLKNIDSNVWDTPYLAEDITRINDLQFPINCAHPTTWNRYSEEEKRALLSADKRYPYNNYFIYEPIPDFKEYEIKRGRKYVLKEDDKTKLPYYDYEEERIRYCTRCYMIDFKKIFHINCNKIKNQNRYPLHEEIQKSKIAELSVNAREKLRLKMASYYGTPAHEDLEFLE